MKLGKYSFGIGDRFAHQAEAQLQALMDARDLGVDITPVWNKSYREHMIINSRSETTRAAADKAIKSLGWKGAWFLDADHINSSNVDFFLDTCDFYTIDVADFIDKKVEDEEINAFVATISNLCGKHELPVLGYSMEITTDKLRAVSEKYLYAVKEAGKIYQTISENVRKKEIVIEVSMDETVSAQTPDEIFVILAALAAEKIPLVTIAPKFSGAFNKGVDYVGNVDLFRSEFEQDLSVLRLAVEKFGLDPALKLSVHSGSDKFSIYPVIGEAIRKFDAGLHLKTAGTTWLEELVGLAEAGGKGLEMAKDIYRRSFERYDELCGPYESVLSIDKKKLPDPENVDGWDGTKFARTLRHEQKDENYNMNFRQLLHVGYKVAAEYGDEYLDLLVEFKKVIGENVRTNLFDRHIKRVFI